ncbi:hypothetical protein DSO57_1023654 [Entomophthora muscae]|uniref:Uncharacterized protein n=1 Tax=Entomophthora muscae TaxID=34485 RepID=A0ACC2S4P7_9FUNG|nr:hypothetical protein DSO57_1023654 [Entomophthora muscae]
MTGPTDTARAGVVPREAARPDPGGPPPPPPPRATRKETRQAPPPARGKTR